MFRRKKDAEELSCGFEDMEDLMDKDKTIAILRHQYERERKENQILKEEIALLEYEIEQLKQQIK